MHINELKNLLEDIENSYLPRVLNGYITCALWSSHDDDGNPLDETYSEQDIAPKTRWAMMADCKQFVDEAGSLLDGLDPEQVGHDLFLTRQGHGAGFWDREYNSNIPDLGKKLTVIANDFPVVDLMVYNGKIYQ